MNNRSSVAQSKWREIIRRHATSGLSVAEFCRHNDVAASSLFAWKRRLGAAADAPAAMFVEAKIVDGEAGEEKGTGRTPLT